MTDEVKEVKVGDFVYFAHVSDDDSRISFTQAKVIQVGPSRVRAELFKGTFGHYKPSDVDLTRRAAAERLFDRAQQRASYLKTQLAFEEKRMSLAREWLEKSEG